jgi:cytochrome c oxidase subunit 1
MPVHTFITHAAMFTAAVQLIFIINLFWSMKKGAKAPMNPWDATTLEWTIPSPPPFDNFAGRHVVINHGAYEYSVPGAEKDFIMQSDPA